MAKALRFESMPLGAEYYGKPIVKCPACGKPGAASVYPWSAVPAANVLHGPVDGVATVVGGLRMVEGGSNCALGLREALPVFGDKALRQALEHWAAQAARAPGEQASLAFVEVAVEAVERNVTLPEFLLDLVLKHADRAVGEAEHAFKRARERRELLAPLSEDTVKRAVGAMNDAEAALERAKARRGELRALATEAVAARWRERFPRAGGGGAS
jgi:hypothetical protein